MRDNENPESDDSKKLMEMECTNETDDDSDPVYVNDGRDNLSNFPEGMKLKNWTKLGLHKFKC